MSQQRTTVRDFVVGLAVVLMLIGALGLLERIIGGPA